ncbi:unnamed protein product [Rhizophagus irregularis]|nr:unnamed protein product [Rhizophagus irregularis]
MALMLLRTRANIPVVVCGEAGCGKTSLIGFLAGVVEVEFRALNIHAVCILNRIPLFIVGSPGSSKSLAIRLVHQNLRGSDSNDEYFRTLPQVFFIPHQGSSSSTSDGIEKVFQKAKAYQETSSKEFPVISVVLLDEVGLAETSPFNPLKVLHSLLEPSYPADGPTVIMMCVEAGQPLILTDLEIIYGSLYDLWNQNYITMGSSDDPKYFTRVALGAYANPMLYVHPDFRFNHVKYLNRKILEHPNFQIDNFKTLYEEEISSLREDMENIDLSTGKLLEHIYEDYIKSFTNKVFNSITLLRTSPLEQASDLYFKDFVSIICNSETSLKNISVLSYILKCKLGKEEILNPILLHTFWWEHASSTLAAFQLVHMCPNIINQVYNDDADLTNENFDDYLVDEVTNMMLRKIIKSQETIELQRVIKKVLNLCEKVSGFTRTESFQLLQICYDLLSTELITLDTIKEIIKTRETRETDDDEIFSARLIHDVFEIFRNIEIVEAEQENKITFAKQSFVMKSLEIIPFESPSRLELYQFVRRFWDETIQVTIFQSIEFNSLNLMETDDFDPNQMLNDLNYFMEQSYPLIHSLKIYFIRDLRNREYSMDDIKKFCQGQTNALPWLGSLAWDNNQETRLQFNAYYSLKDYSDVENCFSMLYSYNHRDQFNQIFKALKRKESINARISFMGIILNRLHAIRATKDWAHVENQVAGFLNEKIEQISSLSIIYRKIIKDITTNQCPLLYLDIEISNSDLLIKSVVGHVIALHSSLPADASPLANLLQNLNYCNGLYILTCPSDVESIILSAVFQKNGQFTRYQCKCGYVYLIGDCGQANGRGKCPECGNMIGGENHVSEAGNTRLDNAPIKKTLVAKDDKGYIAEAENEDINHSVRNLPPASYRILHLFIHSIIGAWAPSGTANTLLQKNNNVASDSLAYCTRHIRNDWKVLLKILNCREESLALLLHAILDRMTMNPPKDLTLKTPGEREDWEAKFAQNYVSPLIKSVTNTANQFRAKLDVALAKTQGNSNIIEGEVNQTLPMDRKYKLEYLPRLWRSIGTISFQGIPIN